MLNKHETPCAKRGELSLYFLFEIDSDYNISNNNYMGLAALSVLHGL